MATLSKSFTATGVGGALSIRSGESFTYDVSGTFVGTVRLEKSYDAVNYVTELSATAAASGTVISDAAPRASAWYRFRCKAFTSGTIVTSIAEGAEVAQSFNDQSGAPMLNIVEGGVTMPGTLAVTGAATVAGALSATGNLAVNTNKFTVAASSGNTVVGGTLDTTGKILETASALAFGGCSLTLKDTSGDSAARAIMLGNGLGTVYGTLDFAVSPSNSTLPTSAAHVVASMSTGGIFTTAGLKTSAGVGTAASGTTAVEYGDGRLHQTILTVATTLPAIAGGANLGVGKLLYTLPAGAQVIESAYMSIAITQTEAHINADTPDVGLGTVIASGVVATLDGTATFENILTGQTAANCTGTATVKTAKATASPFELVREAADAKTIYLNVADGWAASGDAAALLTGTVVINWRTMA